MQGWVRPPCTPCSCASIAPPTHVHIFKALEHITTMQGQQPLTAPNIRHRDYATGGSAPIKTSPFSEVDSHKLQACAPKH
eukprot:1159942-Pelagomonas_calceolata.AAC.5